MSGMKKLLSTGLLALLTTAYLTSSCSRDDFSGSIIEAKKQAFSDNFKAAYGNINPLQDWGFGSATTRGWAFTRSVDGKMPSKPTFTSSAPSQPSIDISGYYTTTTAVKNANVKYGSESFNSDETIYIDSALISTKSDFSINGKDGMTMYVCGNLTYQGGFSANGTTVVVTENSTLKLNTWNYKLKIYLAPKATLDFSDADTQYFELSNNGDSFGGIYMSANSNIINNNGKFRIFNGYKVVNNGGTITVNSLEVDKNSILWNNGTVTVNGELKGTNENGIIYNAIGKTITANSIKMDNNKCLLYNEGTVTCKGDITFTNSGAEIVNNGTLTTTNGGSLDLSAGGKMHNLRTATIDGETKLTNTNSWWMNDGQYTSDTFTINNARHVYNNCKLTVEGNFLIHEGDFIMEGGDPVGGSLICDSFTWEHNPDIWLGSKTLIQVTGTLLAKGFNSGYAIRGIGEEYAVIKATKVDKQMDQDTKCLIAYMGKIYVDAGSHFGQDYMDKSTYEGKQPYYDFDGDVKFSFASTDGGDKSKSHQAAETVPVSIPSGYSCNPGYNTTGGGGDDVTETRVVLKECGRIFCEDLGNVSNRDMDYNDVVFDAWIYVKQTLVNNEVTSESHYRTFIQLLAAGGTIPVDVADQGEIHKKFGVGQTTMVNTYIPDVSEVREDLCVNKTTLPAEYEIRNGLDYYYARDIDNDGIGDICLKNIPIFVEQSGEASELEAIQGDAPQKYCATLGTKWAGERVQIDWAYTAFTRWVNNIDDPWESGVAKYLFTDSGLKLPDGTAYDPLTVHGATMDYDPNDDPSTTSGSTSGTGGSTGGSTTGGTSFNNVTGTVVYQTQTQLSSGSGITISSSEFNDAAAADIYIYGTGTGNVEVNGAPAEDVSSTSAAPIYNFTRGFGFTRTAETPVVKKCTLGPKQFHGYDIGITGNNFTVYKVSYTATQPSVSQPTGTVLVSNANGIEMDWAQKGQQHISADKLTGIGEGTIIRVAGVGYADNNTDASNNTSWQVELDIEDPWTKIGAKTYWTEGNATGAVTVAFVLTAEQAEALLNSQLCVQGVNFILKYVTVDNSNVTPSGSDVDIPGTAVWTIDSYSGQEQKIESTALSALDTSKAAHLVIYGRHTTNWWEIQVMHDWANILTARSDNSYGSCGHWENSDINVPSDGVIIIPLTAAQVTLLRQDGMRVYLGAVTVSKMELRQ